MNGWKYHQNQGKVLFVNFISLQSTEEIIFLTEIARPFVHNIFQVFDFILSSSWSLCSLITSFAYRIVCIKNSIFLKFIHFCLDWTIESNEYARLTISKTYSCANLINRFLKPKWTINHCLRIVLANERQDKTRRNDLCFLWLPIYLVHVNVCRKFSKADVESNPH